MKSILVLGRQPSLGLAELESLYGAKILEQVSDKVVLLDYDYSAINFDRLGGSIKLAKLLTTINTVKWDEIIKFINEYIPSHLKSVPEGKIKFGISAFGFDVKPNQLNKTNMQLKKIINKEGKSIRIIPNVGPTLNSAQIIHNMLTSPLGIELVIIKNGDSTLIGQTVNEQDIEAYARRDQARPKRDARVGMLPPKLAQIIINLAVGRNNIKTVLDPFCGTGVILQEAALMNFTPYGTDVDYRMIEYSQENIAWLSGQVNLNDYNFQYSFETADATSFKWTYNFDTVASEVYLGRPLSSLPNQDVLNHIVQDTNTIIKKFLINLTNQTSEGFELCLAVPAWRINNDVKHLPILDRLDELGYTRMSFVHVLNKDLVYFRENQIVARELVKLIRN